MFNQPLNIIALLLVLLALNCNESQKYEASAEAKGIVDDNNSNYKDPFSVDHSQNVSPPIKKEPQSFIDTSDLFILDSINVAYQTIYN